MSPALPVMISDFKPPAASLTPDEADRESITYGELVQSIYDSLNCDEDSDYYNFPLYGKSELLGATGLSAMKDRYSISHYVYSTVKDADLNLIFFKAKSGTTWIGYIAESTPDEAKRRGFHNLVVVVRGTSSNAEWVKDFTASQSEFKTVDGAKNKVSLGCVHAGFLSMYTSKDGSYPLFGDSSMKDQILEALCNLVFKYKGEKIRITCTGHSLGAALATLVACDMAVYFSKTECAENVSVALFTFASPRVGDPTFKSNIEANVPDIWRYVSKGDKVPKFPLTVGISWPINCHWVEYEHVGVLRQVDASKSPYLVIITFSELFKWHNLELHMHAIAAHSVSSELDASSLKLFRTSSPAVSSFVKMKNDYPEASSLLEDLKEQFASEPESLEDYLQDLSQVMAAQSDAEKTGLPVMAKRRRLSMPSLYASLNPSSSPFDARPYCLLNKTADLVKDEYKVPKNWVVAPNKDMVMVKGKWLTRQERHDDIPGPDNSEYN